MLRCNYIKSTGFNVLLFISVRNLYIVFTYSGSCRDARCQKSWAKLGLRCIGKPRPSVSKGFGKGMSGMPILDDQNMQVYDIEIVSENEVFSDKCRNIVAWTRAKWWEGNRSISGYQHLFQGFCALSFECYSKKITNINFKIVDSIRAGSSSHKFVGRKQLMALGNEFLNQKTKNNHTTTYNKNVCFDLQGSLNISFVVAWTAIYHVNQMKDIWNYNKSYMLSWPWKRFRLVLPVHIYSRISIPQA